MEWEIKGANITGKSVQQPQLSLSPGQRLFSGISGIFWKSMGNKTVETEKSGQQPQLSLQP